MSDRIISLPEVLRLTSFSRTTLYDRIKARAFPSQISLGGRRVGWLEADVAAWISDHVKETRAKAGREV
jgi:prophage regulatory protein